MARTMTRPLRRDARLWALPLSVVALLCTVEMGCVYLFGTGFVVGADACEESAERMAQLSSPGLLPAAPSGAAALDGHADAGSECVDDSSGDPWLVVDHYYRFDGDREAVVAHYRKAAARAGWKPADADSAGAAVSDWSADLCFDTDVSGEPASLSVYFEPAKTILISIQSSLDGTPMGC
ncbi:hypothetical protein [Streptomyces cavernae]|uniref:hypothetical protein n=1 Tax=Streptomyces cavernae TaxID=2259034 RepID=UPI000FEC2081|nr:hypothetical protein [Streptomyces cavernae]